MEGGHEAAGALFHLLGLEVTSRVVTMWAIMVVLALVSFAATRNIRRVPQGAQNAMEMIFQGLMKFFGDILGEEKARRYSPLLVTLFLFILLSNYSGLIPGAGHVPWYAAPTSAWSVTAGWAIIVFFATHYFGVREHGLSYFAHFLKPVPFLLPLNIIEEFVRPLSLSLRLFGNIFGEEMVIATLLALLPYFVPLPMMLLSILFGLIQAVVFTLLAAVYFATATATSH